MTASPPDPYIAGFHDGLGAAARCCADFAENLDVRTETARQAHVRPFEPVRRLRQAASRIRDIEPPAAEARR